MTRIARHRLIFALLATVSSIAAARADETKPEFVSVRAGFAGRYKVGLCTSLEVTVRGGSSRLTGRVRASTTDSDGLTCSFESAEPCEVQPGKETKVPLYVRFGRESSSLTVELFGDTAPLAARTFVTSPSPATNQFPDALSPGRRLIVSVGATPEGMDGALPAADGKNAHNVIAAVESIADLPNRWQGYEGVDDVILSTGRPETFSSLAPHDARIEALDRWVRGGGTLVLAAGEHADEALRGMSALARFAPGRYETTRHLHQGQTGGWETLARSQNQILPPTRGERLDLPAAKLVDVQGQIEAREEDIPLLVRQARGLGQVVFVAADLDRGPIGAWSDRPLLLAAILRLSANEPPPEASEAAERYGFDDLAGQLRSSLEQFSGVRLVPFFAVAMLMIAYVLLIGPGDYFLLSRLRRDMRWTWLTFPALVIFFAAGACWTASRLKGGAIRVTQVDLIDVAADGTARGATWFSIFSPRGEEFDLSLRGRLPNGEAPQDSLPSLGWFGKAGNGFNGMYGRDAENAAPLGGQGYAASPSFDALRDVPVQVASCKNFVFRWLGRAGDQGLAVALHEENRQPTGTIINNLKRSGAGGSSGVTLSHAYLAYDGWAYALGTLRPGEAAEVGSATRRVSLKTFMSSNAFEDAAGDAAQPDKTPYDQGSRDAAYVLRAMLFFDIAGGRKHTGMANDYQGFTDFSGLLRAGRAVLVAMPPQDDSARGADLLRGPVPQAGETDQRQPLASPLGRHAIIYRFVVAVDKATAHGD